MKARRLGLGAWPLVRLSPWSWNSILGLKFHSRRQTRSLAIAKRPCDCCIILKSGSYTKAMHIVQIGLCRLNREHRLTFRRVIVEKWMYTAQMPINNALVLGNLCEYRHKWYIAKTRFLGLHFRRRLYRSILNLRPLLRNRPLKPPNSAKKRKITVIARRSRSLKVTDFGTNRKPICDFLLVINTNVPVSYTHLTLPTIYSV